MELAAVIADRNPHAIRGAKRLCNMLADASDARILQAESDEQVKVIRTPNQVEAVMAHMQKRRRSEEHTSELQSLMRISYAVFCLKKKKNNNEQQYTQKNRN